MKSIFGRMSGPALLELLLSIDQNHALTKQGEALLNSITNASFAGLILDSLPESIVYMSALQSLDVSNNQLTTLPKSIGNLSALQSLNVSNNRLITLPESIGNLSSLQSLDVSHNQLATLPESIGNLSSLQSLDVSHNQLVTLPESTGNLSALQSLNMSCNQLATLPEPIGNLSALRSLNMSRNQLATLPESIGNLSALRSLNMSRNQLAILPESIGNLSALQLLDVSHSQLATLPESIGNLSVLQSLNISGTQLTILPDSIGNLSKLQSLNMLGNELTILPESIGALSALRSLNMWGNELTVLPESIGNLFMLQSLVVSNNQLAILPESIGALSALKSLNMWGNELTVLPESIGNLSALQSLDVSNNWLTTLPESIGNLSALQSLDVSYNQLTTIPSTVGRLSHLQKLNIYKNLFKKLPYEIKFLKKLTKLNLGKNQIREFPLQISSLHNLIMLDLTGLTLHQLPVDIMGYKLDFKFDNPEQSIEDGIFLYNTTLATQPISLFMQPHEFIQAYFDAPKVSVNEGKVIFLGDGTVGKSYTIQRILHGGNPGVYETDMTPGISINRFPVEREGKRFDIQFWDFGGQEVMHAMHRCFLTHRTCYVVMVTDRQPDLNGRARYWLRNIDSFASGCNVLLVVNHWEDYASNDELNYNQLHTDFPNLTGSITVSAKCADRNEFGYLTEKIIDMASKLDSTSMEFPIQWDHIRQELTHMAEKGTNYIDQDQYFQICKNNGLEDTNIRKWLLEWFNDLGTCFSYHQDAAKRDLTEYKVLNPRWLTNAIYILILNGRNFTENGIIHRKGIEHLLEHSTNGTLPDIRYTTAECGYVLEVMRKFTLSYNVSPEKEFIPALCPNETPEELYPISYKAHLKYEREYTYLPDSVVHQLMIYCYQYLRLDRCWRKGMYIELPAFGLIAVVNMGGSDHLLTIDLYSNGRCQLWELLQPLLNAIDRINDKLNLRAKDYVWPETIIDGQTYADDRFELEYILNLR